MEEEKLYTGWLSPTGEFFPCRSYEHISTARELCVAYGIDTNKTSFPDEELLRHGWISISIMAFLEHGFEVAIHPKAKPTQEQLLFLKPYYEGERGLEMIDVSKQNYEYYAGL